MVQTFTVPLPCCSCIDGPQCRTVSAEAERVKRKRTEATVPAMVRFMSDPLPVVRVDCSREDSHAADGQEVTLTVRVLPACVDCIALHCGVNQLRQALHTENVRQAIAQTTTL